MYVEPEEDGKEDTRDLITRMMEDGNFDPTIGFVVLGGVVALGLFGVGVAYFVQLLL